MAAAHQPGDVIAERFRLVEILGVGGMGAVWRAEHLALREDVAVKFLVQAEQNDEARARFIREARASAKLRSPHVVQILDHGVDGTTPYLVMELLAGESLRALLLREGRLPPKRAAKLLGDVARAVGRAHRHGIVHRDLKPSNVQVVQDEDGELAKVLDFGIAKLVENLEDELSTASGSMMGTPAYMSPEQARGRRSVDHRTDMWSFAVIAFECLTGARPFRANTLGQLVLQICAEPIPVPSSQAPVPDGFDAWFARGTERDPDRRFASMKEMGVALHAVLMVGAPSGASAATGDATRPGALEAATPNAELIKDLADPSLETVTAGGGTGTLEATGRPRRWPVLVVASALAAVAAFIAHRQLSSSAAPQPATAPSASASPLAAPVLLSGDMRARAPVLSHDGKKLAFITMLGNEHQVWVGDVGKPPERLTATRHVSGIAFHPDGRHLLWVGGASGLKSWHLHMHPLDGSAPPAKFRPLAFFAVSSDGRRVLGGNHGMDTLLEVSLDTGQVTERPVAGVFQWLAAIDWSPDNQTVLLCIDLGQQQSKRLVLLDAALSAQTTVVESKELGIARFAPDGRELYYTDRDRAGEPMQLYVQPFDPKSRKPIGKRRAVFSAPNMGAGFDVRANRIVFGTDEPTSSIERFDASTEVLSSLTEGALDRRPRIAPDARRVAFDRQGGDSRRQVMTIDIAGGSPTPIASGGDSLAPRWSADGSELAFISDRAGARQVWITPVSGGRARAISHSPALSDSLDWSWGPSQQVVVQQPGNRNFTVVGLDGTHHNLIASEDEGWVFAPVPHPDGKRIALNWNRGGQGGVYVLALDRATDGQLVRKDASVSPIRWATDGESFWARLDRSSIGRIRLADGAIEDMITIPSSVRVGRGEIDITADGKTIVLGVDHTRESVWLADHPPEE